MSGMSARGRVQRCWEGLATRWGWPGAAATAALEEIVRAYSEPHRHYHTLDHIAALLELLDLHGEGIAQPDTVVLAILFHDVVYDPARHDNEEASAALAAERLAALGLPGEGIGAVARCILATRHGDDSDPVDEPGLALLLDLDLSILGAAPAEYRAYAEAIRCEYASVPDELYRPGRRRVLEGFLARGRIYRTDRLSALWEGPARANLASEIAGLAQGAAPIPSPRLRGEG
jgi:predicted metal-dependent HD superfamily phosphohydrolase